MKIRNTSLTLSALFSLVLLATAAAHADPVLFTNFGAGLTYDTSNANIIGNDFAGDNAGTAIQFTVSSSGALSSLDLGLSCFGPGFCPDAYTVALRSDASGAPGTVIESFTGQGSDLGNLGDSNPAIVFTSVLDPMLNVSTDYWVTVTTDTNDTMGWNFNSIGNTNTTAQSNDGGATYFAPSEQTPGALQVNGASPVVSGVTPEPSSFALLTTGLFALAFCVSKRKSILPAA
jgi:hypothetical protein